MTSFKDELKKIQDEYSEGSTESMDKKEVNLLVEHIRNKLNLMNGNITEQDYEALEENVINCISEKPLNENELPEHVFQLVPEDVEMVLNNMKEYYENMANDEDGDVEGIDELEKLRAIDFADLCQFINRKMEIPWTEYIEASIDCYLTYN